MRSWSIYDPAGNLIGNAWEDASGGGCLTGGIIFALIIALIACLLPIYGWVRLGLHFLKNPELWKLLMLIPIIAVIAAPIITRFMALPDYSELTPGQISILKIAGSAITAYYVMGGCLFAFVKMKLNKGG
jgi:hypothetical protein